MSHLRLCIGNINHIFRVVMNSNNYYNPLINHKDNVVMKYTSSYWFH